MPGIPIRAVRPLLVLAAFLTASIPALAQNSVFVFIPTIAGSSVDPAHPSWIDAYALDHSATSPGGGAPSFSGVTVLKGTDAATAALHDALATGAALGTSTGNPVRIEVCRPGPSGQECFYKISLFNSKVTAEGLAGSSCLDPSSCAPAQTESVSFNFERITWRYVDYINGKQGKTFEKCWDLAKNSTCSPF